MGKVTGVVHQEGEHIILRYPTALTESSTHQQLKRMIRLCFEAMSPVFVPNMVEGTRLTCQVRPEFKELFGRTMGLWITELIRNPDPKLAKSPIATDPHSYTMSVVANGVLYAGLYPISNVAYDGKNFSFAFKSKMAI